MHRLAGDAYTDPSCGSTKRPQPIKDGDHHDSLVSDPQDRKLSHFKYALHASRRLVRLTAVYFENTIGTVCFGFYILFLTLVVFNTAIYFALLFSSAIPNHAKMGSPSARPSAKGYAPVPLEERIDDDLEVRHGDAEAEDDEQLYTPAAPLLSERSRGFEPRSWEAPRKHRNWRRIFIFSLFGSMLAAIIALATSTGVIASNYQHYRSTTGGCDHRRFQQNTRLPFNQPYQSSNNRLNFKNVYPQLEVSPYSSCQAAWETLRWVPCHEKIWNRSWDNGKHNLFDPDVALYSNAICSMGCRDAINRAFQLISSQCTEEDRFDMTGYSGPFSADPELEDGPMGVITTIAKRVTHMCREEPTRRYNRPYCAASMWEDWVIVDGMNSGNLEGLDTFEASTRTVRTERAQYKSHSMYDSCDDVNYYQGRYVEERRFGPHVNSTTCSWCTMNWYERKLLSWKKDEVRDPKNGKMVELPDYLKRIRHAGERCDTDAWNRVWTRALRKYKESGDLPDDWEDVGKREDGEEFHTLPVMSAVST